MNNMRCHIRPSYHTWEKKSWFFTELFSGHCCTFMICHSVNWMVVIYVIYLYITITILLWVLSIYPFIKHYTIVVSIITIQFSHMYVTIPYLWCMSNSLQKPNVWWTLHKFLYFFCSIKCCCAHSVFNNGFPRTTMYSFHGSLAQPTATQTTLPSWDSASWTKN